MFSADGPILALILFHLFRFSLVSPRTRSGEVALLSSRVLCLSSTFVFCVDSYLDALWGRKYDSLVNPALRVK